MNFKYGDNKVKRLFEDLTEIRQSKNLMLKKIGKNNTIIVKRRLEQLKAMPNFFSLQQSKIGKIESLSGDFKGCYSMRITKNYRLIIKPLSSDLSPESLKECKTINIVGVIDYHGKRKNWIIP